LRTPAIARTAFLLLPLLAWAAIAGAGPAGVTRVEPLSGGVRFVLTAPAGEPRLFERAGEPPSIEWADLASVASPDGWQLPLRTAWVAVPREGEVTVSYETIDTRPLTLEGRSVPPAVTFPERSVELGAVQWMRDQRVVPILWAPIVRTSGGVVVESAVRVTVRFSGGGAVSGVPNVDGAWERVYSDLLVNYGQARSWRREAARPRAVPGSGFWPAASPWIRLEVPHTGLFSVTGADLQAAGVDIDGITPDSLRIFAGAGVSLDETDSVFDLPEGLREIAIRLDGATDGALDPQDRILFHAVGPDGWYAEYGLPDAKHERYRLDEFSNVNTYWLAWGSFQGSPRRWESVDGSIVSEALETTAFHRVHYQRELIWDPRPRTITNIPPPYPDTLPAWEKWHWLELIASRSNTRSQLPFVVPDPAADADATIRIRMWGASYVFLGQLLDHMIRLDLNGTPLAERLWDDLIHKDIEVSGIPLAGENQILGLQVPYRGDTTAVTTDRQYLGWFELEYRRNLAARGDSIEFWVEPGSAPRAFSVDGFSLAGSVLVLDVTDPWRTVTIAPRFETVGSTRRATWQVDGDPERLRHIRIVSEAQAGRPRISVDTPPEGGYLRERTNAVDYILITHRSFMDAAGTLADWRSTHGGGGDDGLRVAAVDVQDIYDEFSAGRVDPTAIRNFLRWAYERWNGGDPGHRPTYVTFLGDTSFDFRNRLQQGASVFVPSYEGYYDPILRHSIYQPQFATDDWLVLFDRQPDATLDMAAGRLPADNPASAAAVVEKVIDYESRPAPGPWRQRFTLVADDICQGLSQDALGFTHMRQTETLADSLPVELERDRVYLYEFGTECLYDRKPASAAALRERIDDGTLVVNYTGHGSEGQLADERVLETSSVGSMTNRDHLFFFLTASCSVGKFNFAGTGLGEALVRQPRGGAIGVFSATAVAFSGANAELNQAFFEAVWPRKDVLGSVPLGQAAVIAKSGVANPSGLNNRRYPLLGEPAIVLGTPRLRCAMQVTGLRAGVASPDTLYRGGRADLHGEVVDDGGVLRSDYDGRVQVEVYDSDIQRDASAGGGLGSFTYYLTGSPIFRGTANVTGGIFDLSFIAPSALRTGPRGLAAVYAYADDDAGVGAIGSLTRIAVPEIPPEAFADQEGPIITVRPLSVVDLDAVPPDTRWEAVMDDTSGINITQLVPSRSVLLRIEEGSRIVGLEDLAADVTFPDGSTRGRVEFQLPSGLQSGVPYRLTLEASDNRDHRGSKAVDFRLQGTGPSGLDFARVYNVPNPTDGATTFFLDINRPASVEIRVFTSSGRTIRTIRPPTSIQPVEASSEGIRWDGRDEDGDVLANGVYFYKVTVRDDDGSRESRVERLAVVR
jgi:hypothetical protein